MTSMAVAVPARQAEVASLAEPVGDLVAHALAEIGVTTAFGVISIHNMPILDAIARGNRIRFVPARSEAGAMNMADGFARVSRSLGVVITSTGTAAGNAPGARQGGAAALGLAGGGFGVVNSTNGRAVVPETHKHTLGAYNMTGEAQAIYDRADLMIVVGSRLRGNETRNNTARLPRPLIQIDADAGHAARNYPVDLFINADARSALEALRERLPGKLDVDGTFLADIAPARTQSAGKLAAALGP